MDNNVIQTRGLFCIECDELCYPYEQGLCCGCDVPWETQVINESEYPSKWKPVTVTITEIEK